MSVLYVAVKISPYWRKSMPDKTMIHTVYKTQYGKESTKGLTKKEASEIIEAIQESKIKIPTGEKQEDLFEEGGQK